MSVVIGPYNLTVSFSQANFAPREKITTPLNRQISQELNALGRLSVADRAFEISLRNVSKLLDETNVQVSVIYDVTQGSQVKIASGDKGWQIQATPPDSVVDKDTGTVLLSNRMIIVLPNSGDVPFLNHWLVVD